MVMFADVQSVDNDASATELNKKIATFKEEKSVVAQSLTWTGTGDISVISGGCVHVKISALGLTKVMYVDEDTHTFENGKHQMKLKLNYVPDYKSSNGSSGSGNSSTWNKKYRVTARSGLFIRKEPNGTKLTAIPYGKTAEGDGKSKNGWLHVRYKGTTGYSYSGYLKEI